MLDSVEQPLRMPERSWELIALLALHRGEHLARKELAYTLWPESPDEVGLANLRRHLHLCAKALEAYDAFPWFASDRHAVWWHDAAAHRCDLHDFLEYHAAEEFNDAVAAYGGELLQDFDNEWIEPYRQRVRAFALDALSAVASGHDDAAALFAAERMLAADPYDERAIRAILRILAARGERAAALVRYRSFALTLLADLNVKPSPETQQLYRDVASDATQTRSDFPSLEHPIVGRSRELAEIGDHLRAGAAVTIVGPGGVGKTRLALEVAFAHKVLQEHHVVVVDFSSLRYGDNLAAHVLERLQVGYTSGEEIQTIALVARTRKLLLVLDNCEQIARAAAELIEALSTMDSIRVLATSRRPLGHRSECCFRLEPLAVEDASHAVVMAQSPAVSLFLLRASEASPGLIVDDAAKAHARSIARSLDGLPLALEIAASRAASFSLADIDRRLARNIDLSFPKAPAQLSPRQGSLRAVLDWSYSLLGDRTKALLPRLIVFPDSWDIDAAHAICGRGMPESEFADQLSELIDLSFCVRQDSAGSARYAMPETVRRYLSEQLDASTLEELSLHHAHYFLNLAASLTDIRRSAGILAYMRSLRPNSRNLFVALRYFSKHHLPMSASTIAYALTWYWRRTGFTRKGLEVLTAALVDARVDDASYALMYRAAAILALNIGEWVIAEKYNERAEELLYASGQPVRAVEARLGIVHARSYMGNTNDDAIAVIADAVRELHQLGDKVVAAEASAELGLYYHAAERPREAVGELHKAIEFLRERGLGESEATALLQICPIYTELGLLNEACDCAARALSVFREIGDPEMTAHALTRLAETRILLHDLEQARADIRDAIAVLAHAQDPRQTVRALGVAAEYLAAANDLDGAARVLGYALHFEHKIGVSRIPLAHARRELIARLRATTRDRFDILAELGSLMTLDSVREALGA